MNTSKTSIGLWSHHWCGRRRFFSFSRRSQRGQSTIFGVAFALMIMTGIYTLYNVGQVTNNKAELVNATDAAAYSSAIHVSRNLNYIAYTNRAMIANHVVAGHMTSYWSWVHYAEEHVGLIDDICEAFCRFIPYVGSIIEAYVDILDELVETAVDVAEESVPELIRVADLANRGLLVSQQAARLTLITFVGDRTVEEEILQAYSPQIELYTDPNPRPLAGNALNARLAAAVGTSVADRLEVSRYLDQDDYTTGNDGNDDRVMKDMVEQSVDIMARARSDRWMRNGDSRNWRQTIFPTRAIKDGSVEHLETDEGLSWRTSDRYRFQTFDFSKFRWRTRFSTANYESETTDDELYENYAGIPSYVAENEDRLPDCFQSSFTASGFGLPNSDDCMAVTVVARRNLGQVGILQPGDGAHEQSGQDMYAVARAEIFFQRPHTMLGNFSSNQAEFANVFNPFWKARLSD